MYDNKPYNSHQCIEIFDMIIQMEKYQIIVDDIKQQISHGQLKYGDHLPSEKQLCANYKVARTTVRHALGQLAADGYLIRKVGDGTYVNNSNYKNVSHQSQSFSQDMALNGKTPGSHTVDFQLLTYEETTYFGEKLELTPGDQYYFFVRLRTGDDIPIALSYTYLPYYLIPDFDPKILNGSLYDYFSKNFDLDLSNKMRYKDRTIAAVLPTPRQRKLLKITNEPLLKITHPTHLKDGRPFEYSETYYVGSRFVYTWK